MKVLLVDNLKLRLDAPILPCMSTEATLLRNRNLYINLTSQSNFVTIFVTGELRKTGEGTTAPAGTAQEPAQPQRRDTERLCGAVSVATSEL